MSKKVDTNDKVDSRNIGFGRFGAANRINDHAAGGVVAVMIVRPLLAVMIGWSSSRQARSRPAPARAGIVRSRSVMRVTAGGASTDSEDACSLPRR